MFRTVPLPIIRSFFHCTHSNGICHRGLLCVQWKKTPDDRQKNGPKHVEFYSKNKFEKLMHLVGFFFCQKFHELTLKIRINFTSWSGCLPEIFPLNSVASEASIFTLSVSTFPYQLWSGIFSMKSSKGYSEDMHCRQLVIQSVSQCTLRLQTFIIGKPYGTYLRNLYR